MNDHAAIGLARSCLSLSKPPEGRRTFKTGMARKNTVKVKPPKKSSAVAATVLKGWKQIADFLGQPVAVAQRWGRTGMPVRREGRYAVSSPDELNRWLGQESGSHEPVRIVTEDNDLSADLKRGLALARGKHREKRRR
jgi:hypothetical protein